MATTSEEGSVTGEPLVLLPGLSSDSHLHRYCLFIFLIFTTLSCALGIHSLDECLISSLATHGHTILNTDYSRCQEICADTASTYIRMTATAVVTARYTMSVVDYIIDFVRGQQFRGLSGHFSLNGDQNWLRPASGLLNGKP